jgi:glutathione S-transferase
MPLSDQANITLIYAPRSRAATALRFLEELGEPYRVEVIDLEKGDQKKPEFLKRNPMGKVPLVLDGDVPVAETGAIFTYLADKYAPGRLAPRPDQPERAAYLRWMFFGAGVMEPAYGEKFFKWEVPSRQVGWGSFDDMLATVTEAVTGREWLLGDQFTAADIYVANTLRYGALFGIIPNDGPVGAYIARFAARPADKRTAEIEARLAAGLGS